MKYLKPVYIVLIVLAVIIVGTVIGGFVHADSVRCPGLLTEEPKRYGAYVETPCPLGGNVRYTCNWNGNWEIEDKGCNQKQI